ncbi:MAG: 3-phosphoshikimate 1-carboxyvinyltransferase [Planctomycetaceae bacterium]|jgi:3-phosphoshikimate 1-carboxyvinyltransferase|nr:3-phosphoshikimate 1-carboxyvinyltransferase [Planctomycetaceae bacterium]
MSAYTQAVLKFPKLNTQAQQREAVVQGRSLPPIPASVYDFLKFRIGMDNTKKIIPIGHQLDAEVFLPGSKSITNRALLLAACCDGETVLGNALESEDTQIMIDGLRQLGVSVVSGGHNLQTDKNQITVSGLGGKFPVDNAEIYIGNSGTTVRFLTALLALTGSGEYTQATLKFQKLNTQTQQDEAVVQGQSLPSVPASVYRLHGKERMHQRPINDLVDTLRLLGGNIRYENSNGSPPLIIGRRGELDKRIIEDGVIKISVAGNISSQFLSAILMAIPIMSSEGDVEVEVKGELVSRPYVGMTVGMMRSFGVNLVCGEEMSSFRFRKGEKYSSPKSYRIESDASAASYFFAAAAVCGGTIRLGWLAQKSMQGDVGFVGCLAKMGCSVQFDDIKNIITVSRSLDKPLEAISVDMNYISDTAQTLGVVALFANGTTEIKNIEHVRYKETDRITALANELRKFGATVEEQRDGLKITPPKKFQPAIIETYDDHRMAMSFAIAGLKTDGVIIKAPDCVQKTFPNFFTKLQELY